MLKHFLYLLMGLLILAATLWWTRYQVVERPAPRGIGFYRMDRFTGKTEFVTFSGNIYSKKKLVIVEEEKPKREKRVSIKK